MKYWWVNQNQTFQQEFTGGYLWSPKRQLNGGRSQYYENMKQLIPGDIVFSYAKMRIQAIGIVRSRCYDSKRPEEFGVSGNKWANDGWKVDVEYLLLENRIKPKEYINQLQPLLPTKYSPLQKNGNGIQTVYLTEISEPIAKILINAIGFEFFSVEENRIETEIQNDATVDITTKEALIQSRRGQGIFRKNLEKFENKCRISNVKNKEHLIASHIKPWKDSSNKERLDGENGLLLSPNIDHLFDRGYISFESNGNLIISSEAEFESLGLMGINVNAPLNVGSFTEGQKDYLSYHRQHVYKK
jgi:putative restriction endonuclease